MRLHLMKTVMLSLMLGFNIYASAQCPPGSLILSSQGQVDTFLMDYPNCVDLNESLYIENPDVTDCGGLSKLNSVNGSIIISRVGCTNLDFSNLKTLGTYIHVIGNSDLVTIDFSSLSNVPSYVRYFDNPNLENILMNSVVNIGGTFSSQVNYELSNLGLSSLVNVDGYFFLANTSLTNLNTLANLTTVDDYLWLAENSLLTDCTGICSLLLNNGVSGWVDILLNPSKCSSQSEVEASCSPLPVDIVSFDGSHVDGDVHLTWTSINEVNIAGYSIQKLTDGDIWRELNFISSNPDRTGGQLSYYDYMDIGPHEGVSVYRLKILEQSDEFYYSKVITVENDDWVERVTVIPNPAQGKFSVLINDVNKDSVVISITDHLGKFICSRSCMIVDGIVTEDFEGLASGHYVLTIKSGATLQHRTLVIVP